MVTCPWCGTNYFVYQPICSRCGGAIQPQAGDRPPSGRADDLPDPPPPPRSISERYAWRLLFSEGWGVGGMVFGLIGAIFSVVGLALTAAIVTAFVGVPFLLLGLIFLGFSIAALAWRYQEAQKVVGVLRDGLPAEGEVTSLEENHNVSINGRYPWDIAYAYRVGGRAYTGKVSTLNSPGPHLQPGKAVRVLYLASAPERSSIYPHP